MDFMGKGQKVYRSGGFKELTSAATRNAICECRHTPCPSMRTNPRSPAEERAKREGGGRESSCATKKLRRNLMSMDYSRLSLNTVSITSIDLRK